MTVEAKAPKPICSAPIRAEALPAFREKGAKARAAALGLTMPTEDKNQKNIIIAPARPNQLLSVPIKKKTPATV
ncbi:hypothetical protein D3C87_2052760 [compost metagenome]